MAHGRYQRLSAERWQALLDEQQHSGLSMRAFCKARGLTVSTFYGWKKRLSDADATGASFERLFTALTPALSQPTGPEGGWEIELDLGDGVCLRLRRR